MSREFLEKEDRKTIVLVVVVENQRTTMVKQLRTIVQLRTVIEKTVW
jgi:hypothetical protein